MLMRRRRFLAAAASLGAAAMLPDRVRAARRVDSRVVIVGGGWGGLSAARHLREADPGLDITLIERNPAFWSCPLSNKWLVGRIDETRLRRDYAAAAQRWGYRFVQGEVSAIDRDRRRVVSSSGSFDYDWLVIAVGIRHDYRAWFGDDREAADFARATYPAAWTPGAEFAILRDRLARFRGGDLLMTIPPAPFRCPPAPYERAALLAGWLESRGIPGRIVILDANPPFQEFQRLFRDFDERIVYRSQTPVVSVDPRARIVRTEFEDFGFDEAILMPPQQAGDLAWQAGLIGRDAKGRPTGWADIDPLTLAARNDDRIFMIGDMIDRVSPLFGHYPKSAHMAASQGRLVARRIVALARGKEVPQGLPDSLCHIATRFEPPEAIRLAAAYRLRGDGVLMQQTKVERDPQPRDEDVAWLESLLDEILAR
ncbi:MAG: FAD/NAD(P)-binding oxidoreductase [Rhodocyclaceae bacterium]|jgi:NADPH-dependent 2,4-dienoyl-CoA reductase/sulfur reductase-like enzyme|nr:FAD/NAD(P)-binding oxidoreductase [Rhodocyclaceae bacterium]